MNIETLYQRFNQCSGVDIDSRYITENSIFFALKGPNFNANLYASDALKKGSKLAVVDDPNVITSDKFILVNDALKALQQLALYHRNRLTIPVIGITGSNGKTTTKELINNVLSKQYKVAATKGNFNNHIGVPLTILNINKDDEIAIIEMGANHTGEIEFLCQLSKPNYGIITNVGKAHLEGFGSFKNIIETKKALYNSVNEKEGLVFVNKSDSLLKELSEGIPAIYYQDKNGLNGEIIRGNSEALTFKFETSEFQSSEIKTNLFGNYNLSNAMAAVAIGLYFNITAKHIADALSEYQPKNNRSEWLTTEKNKIILDAYNANPTSTLAALDHFNNKIDREKVVILGDMLELGHYAAEEHQRIVNYINKHKMKAIFVGSNYESCDKISTNKTFINTDELINFLKEKPLINQTLLLKGSRGIKLEKLVDYL